MGHSALEFFAALFLLIIFYLQNIFNVSHIKTKLIIVLFNFFLVFFASQNTNRGKNFRICHIQNAGSKTENENFENWILYVPKSKCSIPDLDSLSWTISRKRIAEISDARNLKEFQDFFLNKKIVQIKLPHSFLKFSQTRRGLIIIFLGP